MNALQSLQKFRVRVIPGKCTPPHGGVRFEVEDLILLALHVLTGPTSPRQSVVNYRQNHHREAINREPQYVATGATAALTAILRCNRSYHSVPRRWRFKLNNGGRKPILRYKPSAATKKRNSPKTQRMVQDVDGSCIAGAADLCIIPIGKNVDNTQHVVSR